VFQPDVPERGMWAFCRCEECERIAEKHDGNVACNGWHRVCCDKNYFIARATRLMAGAAQLALIDASKEKKQ
jgi:hypothetical protein